MRGAVLVLALVALGTAPVLAQRSRENRDVPWFQAHPQILDETLRRCQRDARLAATWECQNAEAAGASRMGQPLPNTLPRTGQSRPAPPVDNSGLPEPDFNPRSNPAGYQSLKRACTERGPGSDMLTPYCYQLDRYREGGSGGR
ncbi:hypothetical protein M0638_21080 [Roseomonas sp. NAR14]|uniref:Uncharacterized protein n=1 Tax=Roseomonas acroporae TaxID=2937791 RepID=A0A9X1YIM2_9PROT|nr:MULTISPECIES: hypothetical protein [Roseomonas]MCG7352881.1 hypothetical protein [Roseomonas mucosa]MCG7356139.1 hypothetical protein [Roseomonas mucosa]MCK8786871.1 hypothetical protein [Roseomonas acroporae]MDT8294197.1 hypothetical protein [Roseomonas mucosa]UFN51805.1 hypothetical protein LPC08_25995 [Roseomonas sp. OT10]